MLGFKGKQEDLFVNVVTEECALRVSVIYPSTSPRKPDFSSSRWNLCELFLPSIFLFHSDLAKYSDSSVTHIHDLLTRNYRIYHQDPEHERFKWQTFMESPIWGTKIQRPFRTRKAHKWEPPQLPALQKIRQSVDQETKWKQAKEQLLQLTPQFLSFQWDLISHCSTRERAKSHCFLFGDIYCIDHLQKGLFNLWWVNAAECSHKREEDSIRNWRLFS